MNKKISVLLVFIFLIFLFIFFITPAKVLADCIGATTNFSCGDTVTESCTLNQSSSSSGNCFTIGANDLIIEGASYTITGDASGSGIYMDGKANISIKNIIIENFDYGIYFRSSSNNTVNNSIINNSNSIGIYSQFTNAVNNTLINNTIRYSGLQGIRLSGPNNTVTNNTIT